jgi:hypothetical protein
MAGSRHGDLPISIEMVVSEPFRKPGTIAMGSRKTDPA